MQGKPLRLLAVQYSHFEGKAKSDVQQQRTSVHRDYGQDPNPTSQQGLVLLRTSNRAVPST